MRTGKRFVGLLVAVVWLVLMSVSVGHAAVNLVQNPGFEDGVLDPWVGTNWTVTSSDAHSGTYSAECTTGHTIRQFTTPVSVADVQEVSIWTRSVDMVEHPVQLLYSESGGDWDEFLLWPSTSGWMYTDLTSNLRASGTLYGILVYGSSTHVVRLDDAKIMVDDAVATEATTWSQLQALYR